jgi:hypothetical protein
MAVVIKGFYLPCNKMHAWNLWKSGGGEPSFVSADRSIHAEFGPG